MYRFYTLARDLRPAVSNGRKERDGSPRAAKTIIFSESPPLVEGFYDVPRQSVKLQEMEVGATNLDYGQDPANGLIRLTFIGVPEVVMATWMDEYLDRVNVDGVYVLTDHRRKTKQVKWKACKAELQGTLSQEDVRYWLDHYMKLHADEKITLDLDDPFHTDIADMFKVTMEFFVVPPPLDYT